MIKIKQNIIKQRKKDCKTKYKNWNEMAAIFKITKFKFKFHQKLNWHIKNTSNNINKDSEHKTNEKMTNIECKYQAEIVYKLSIICCLLFYIFNNICIHKLRKK